MTFIDFFHQVCDPESPPNLSPARFCAALGTDLSILAACINVRESSIERRPYAQVVQTFLRESLRVLRASSDISGDLPKAIASFRNYPIAQLGYETPERLVANGRTDSVLKYIALLHAGASG